jgi:hypothetical protein
MDPGHKVLTRHQAPAATDSNAKWLDWFTATDDQVLQSTTGTRRALRLTSWSHSRTELASVRSYLQHYLNTVKGRPYHRHAPGHGRAYRLRGSILGAGNEGGSLTKAGKQSGTALISTAAVIALREGGESAVSTTGGLDSSFVASTASTRRSGDSDSDREGGGQEEEGASNHTEEEGGSYAEEEGTMREWGGIVSFGAGGARGDAFPAATSASVSLITQPLTFAQATKGSQALSTALEIRRGQGDETSTGRAGGTSGDGGEWRGKRGDGRGQSHEQWRRVLGMTRGCTDGTGRALARSGTVE